MLRVTFIILQVCSSAQASTPDCQNGCVSGDDANTLLQAHMHATSSVASPLVQEIKGLSLIGSRGHNALMRETLKDMTSLASGLMTMTGARNLSLVEDIFRMLNNTLVPGLKLAVSSAQTELDNAHEAIDTCNTDASTEESDINGDEKVAKDNAKAAHEACRTAEAGKLRVAEQEFTELENFRKNLDPPEEDSDPVTEQIAYYEAARTFFNTETPELIQFQDDSVAANASFDSQHRLCNSNQTQFESDFCVYRSALNQGNMTAYRCYERTKASFVAEETAKKALEEEFVQEYIAMKKIQCFLRVWLESGSVTDIDKSITAVCDAESIVTQPVELHYEAVPDAYLFDLQPVAVYPGQADFADDYYTETKIKNYGLYQDVTAC